MASTTARPSSSEAEYFVSLSLSCLEWKATGKSKEERVTQSTEPIPLPEASVTSVYISHEFGIVKHKTLDNDDLSAWNDEHIIGDQFMTVGMPFLVDGVSSAEWVENCGANRL